MHRLSRLLLALAHHKRSAYYSSKAAVAPETLVSSCLKGTTLKGINILKDGKDPVAMEDTQYPPWLWTMLENDGKKTDWTDEEKLSIRYLRTLSKAKIMHFSLNKGN
ncbi:39S ribosomal protein L37, mitochondrial [Kappamyces sp. JEL0829]|nr:39S ribosomal protein L37, mitochondrial [Kappamyces sp. JEL0829]KAJ3343548.1 39S ribosomal protein L37, mitochondrial [Kappamyces sp. JEL0680]